MKRFLAALLLLALPTFVEAQSYNIITPLPSDFVKIESNRLTLDSYAPISSLLGVRSITCPANQFISSIGTNGNPGCSLFNYTMPWTGGASTTQAARNLLGPYVTDFVGVDPTGATDSTVGFQAAINAVCANGVRKLFVPAGSYLATAITLPCSGLVLTGAGERATTLRPTSLSGNFITAGVAGTVTSDLRIENIAIISDLAPTRTNANLYVVDVNNFYAEHLTVYYGSTCVQVENSSATVNRTFLATFQNSNVSSCVNGYVVGQSATLVASPQDVFINQGALNGNSGCGLLIFGVSGLSVKAIDAVGNGSGLCVTPGASQNAYAMRFYDFKSDTSTGIGGNFNGSGKTGAVDFVDSWFSSSGGINLAISGNVDDLQVHGGQIIGGATQGVLLSAGPKNVRIDGVSICNNSTSSANTYDGIVASDGASHYAFTNNKFGSCSVTAQQSFPNQRYGIFNGTGNDYYQILGNDLSGNGTGPLLNGSAGANAIIQGNTPSTVPVMVFGSTAVSCSGTPSSSFTSVGGIVTHC